MHFRTEVEEVTIDSTGSWKPVSVKMEKQDDDFSGGLPSKRLKSMSHDTNPLHSPNGAQPRTPYSQQQPLTPQNLPTSPANRPPNTPTTTQGSSRTPQPHPMAAGTPTSDTMGPPLFPQSSAGMSTTQNGSKQHTAGGDGLKQNKDKLPSSTLSSPDPIRKPSASNIPSSKSSGTVVDSGDVSHSKDQCNPDADLSNSYLNLDNIFEASGDNNEEGSLEVLPDNLDPAELLSYLGPPDLPSEDILSMLE